mmetsp:Transcript_24120/g.36841  ORF Transcript_24120/g.36841 Transcript_24120/m.36841 type:complete len:117 (-) Transcript_24120:44-394(-)
MSATSTLPANVCCARGAKSEEGGSVEAMRNSSDTGVDWMEVEVEVEVEVDAIGRGVSVCMDIGDRLVLNIVGEKALTSLCSFSRRVVRNVEKSSFMLLFFLFYAASILKEARVCSC